jgi:hypothetical protein
MKRYKVICEFKGEGVTDTHFVEADYYDITDGILDLYINDEEIGASFVAGYWKAVMICDDKVQVTPPTTQPEKWNVCPTCELNCWLAYDTNEKKYTYKCMTCGLSL